ncbi:hypothetical protein CAC42_1592 [Sphaceloma murrayae]|uniref:Spindle pole body protein ppc89 n=1 Tax=Sphaceloma murrayae TaxID=2082308 RepID=A0A2K1R392_9PEZI|nr:hypothetical protein CAC42_1592 [Sphaceloma murrayae]
MAPAREPSGVIAQLSRGQRRTSRPQNNSPSLPGQFDGGNSTVTSFQPDRESTQQFDTAADEQVWQGDGSEHSGEGDSMDSDVRSVEIGRGMKKSTRTASERYAFSQDMSEEQVLSLPDDSLYNLTATPPMRSAARKSMDLRKQASLRRATTERDLDITRTSEIIPAKSRANLGRRTLSDMHAKINAISDSSFIQPEADGRPAGTRNSRFSRARVSSAGQDLPSRYTSTGGLLRPDEQTPRRSTPTMDASIIGNQTAQSFALPDLPNIAELVSGVRKDGTPIFSRTTKPRSRFTSATYSRGAGQDGTQHAPINSIALPEEEKAIFTSLQLLKEKVSQLEMEKSEAAKRAEEFENEIMGLRSQVTMERRLRRPDSGFGSDEERQGGGEWRVEKSQLLASLKTTEQRLDRAERKVSVSDIAVKRITQERDSLITQLGVAFYSNEELKEENMQLRAEVDGLEEQKETLREEVVGLKEEKEELKRSLLESEKAHDGDLRRWAVREAELKARCKSRSVAARERGEVERKKGDVMDETRPRRSASAQDAQSKIMERVEIEVRKARAEAARQSQIAARKSRGDKSKSRSRSRPREEERLSLPARNEAAGNAERWLDGLSDGSSVSEPEVAVHPKKTRRGKDTTEAATHGAEDEERDITYLSFLDPSELSSLRKKLEAERIAAKGQRSTSAPTEGEKTRKSSMKDLLNFDITGRENRNVRVQSPETADCISYSGPQAGSGRSGPDGDVDVDASLMSTASKRPTRSRSFEEMTSAFILPDITLKDVGKGIRHDGKNCLACPGKETTKTVPMPKPVSDRDDVDATNMTVRPAEEPRQALARVLKGLQDEVVHLKLELEHKQKEYGRHDPAVGRRRRTEIKERMEELIKEVEKRSEMVYRLYDVLEGQKEGIEDTLRSLGLDVEFGRGKRGKADSEAESVDIVEGSLVGY